MADEMMQEPTAESVPAAQEPLAAETGENQQVQADTTAPASESQQEAAPASDAQEIEEWTGNDVDKLPKPLQARAKGMLRYLHSKSQEAANAIKEAKAQALQELTGNPDYQAYQQWQQQRQQTQSPQISSEPLSEDDFLAAQVDPAKFVEVQERLLMQKAQPILSKLQSLEQKVQAYEQEKQLAQTRQKLDAFAAAHPDFYEIAPEIMEASIREVVQRQGGSLEDAYAHAKSLEKKYLERANGAIKQQIEAKKKAVSATPSKPSTPEIIYADDRATADKIAFDYAKLGQRVDVRVKKR